MKTCSFIPEIIDPVKNQIADINEITQIMQSHKHTHNSNNEAVKEGRFLQQLKHQN